MVLMMMMVRMMMAMVEDVDVDAMEGGRTSLGPGVPPSLNEPHDHPYPMQPYVNHAVAILWFYKS